MTPVLGPTWTDGSDGRYAGRYPLAVERHAIREVGRCLPAVTTVTSHARYYTLHTAVFAEAQRRSLTSEETRALFRRCEVVVGAVSLAHGRHVPHDHFRGVHGGERISPYVAAGEVDIASLAADGGYVQAAWGFRGPYGAGEFNLGLLDTGHGNRTVPGPAADPNALERGWAGLFDIAAASTATLADLDAASSLCVCQGFDTEDGALLRRLLVPENPEPMHSGDRRGQTLRLLLRLTDLLDGVERPESEVAKALVYGEHREDPSVAALDVASAWTGIVLRNELVTAWRNLWAHLVDAIEGFMAISRLGEAFADGLPPVTVKRFVDDLPAALDSQGRPLDALARIPADHAHPGTAYLAPLAVSASRHGRVDGKVQAYLQGDRDEAMQQLTPEWTQSRLAEWADRPVRDFAVWLTHQLVARAERVAMAKASFNGNTGRFSIPTRVLVRDGHIYRASREGGGGVSLRWSSAFQIMAGAGLVQYADGRWRSTEAGRAA